MHILSLRAFRSAALSLQKPPLLGPNPGRLFHASALVRAAADGGEPRDDGNRPERAGEGENAEDNLFGDSTATSNGESQGRKKPGNGSLRSRTLRNRKPEELPPVHVPKSFLSNAVSRLEDIIGDRDQPTGIPKRDIRSLAEGRLYHTPPGLVLDEQIAHLLDSLALNEETLSEALDQLKLGSDGKFGHREGDFFVSAAVWAAVLSVREIYGRDAATQLLERSLTPSSTTTLIDVSYLTRYGRDVKKLQPSQVKHLIEALDEYPLGVSAVHSFEEDLIKEIVAAVNTDLLVQAPKNVKLTDLRRPVTLINTADYSGYSVPRDIVRDVAAELGADVLHLKASDIAQVVGAYLGQDAVRAPGAISQLGYKAAENSGRINPNRNSDGDDGEPEEVQMPYTIMVRDERLKKENKRYISLMDEFLNGSNRGKNDELWEDLKVNAALEELVHSADSETSEQKPLIVHIDDFNALTMDLECGATIIGKIRKVVDGLWLDGRKIALVGTCSTKNAPQAYITELRKLESTERVITLRTIVPPARSIHSTGVMLARRTALEAKRKQQERNDYVRENERNIISVLLSMVEPPPETDISTTGEIDLIQLDGGMLPESWARNVLPLNDVYRIATTIIGHAKNPADVFNIESFERAAATTKKLEQLKEKYARSKSREDKHRRSGNESLLNDLRKLGGSEESYEERMESGLVNAEDIRTTFKDVHAPKETIESVKMLTTLSLIRPEAFSYGVLATDRIPGCLLYGPPGTGKTLLAKAVAKESGANMIEISGASINNKYVGESEKNVRALFQLANKKEPLVIFIDEADALLGARGGRGDAGGGSRRETLNQFLKEWDGMDRTKAFIMVATNRPFDLDEAVLRRLPRKLLIDLPLARDRASILRIHLRDEILDDQTVSVDDLARRTPLYSGSDLKNVCVAAAMAAVKEELELELLEEKVLGVQPQEQTEEEAGTTSNANATSESKKRRVLAGRHFDKALQEIGASVSEDMATLTAIRKFDEKYGDGGAARRRKRKGMGFEVVAEAVDAQEARVRSGR
ncbi:hypothetical protein M426DRAFT_320646 [Hypoxylon sp. CI-4A]|nr:hypothetical protein M426DRAFT_320646 [Hypoxylon sp. CI-4A]